MGGGVGKEMGREGCGGIADETIIRESVTSNGYYCCDVVLGISS